MFEFVSKLSLNASKNGSGLLMVIVALLFDVVLLGAVVVCLFDSIVEVDDLVENASKSAKLSKRLDEFDAVVPVPVPVPGVIVGMGVLLFDLFVVLSMPVKALDELE